MIAAVSTRIFICITLNDYIMQNPANFKQHQTKLHHIKRLKVTILGSRTRSPPQSNYPKTYPFPKYDKN